MTTSQRLTAIRFVSHVLIACSLTGVVTAQPKLAVTSIGANADGDLQWRVDVQPDSSLFTNGRGSLAAEIGFELTGSVFLDATVNESVWAFSLPGVNPFTDVMTDGLSLAGNETFVSFGSDPVEDVVELLTITTQGSSATTLSWGGYTIRPGRPSGFDGARLAQAGITFDAIAGSLVAGSLLGDCNGDGVVDAGDLDCACGSDTVSSVLSATGLLAGDLDGDGGVRFGDFLMLSGNFGSLGLSYTDGDIDCSGAVDFADFLTLSANFGRTSAATLATVPEPTNLVAIPLIGLLVRSRRRRT